jgi:hypothetical protein
MSSSHYGCSVCYETRGFDVAHGKGIPTYEYVPLSIKTSTAGHTLSQPEIMVKINEPGCEFDLLY